MFSIPCTVCVKNHIRSVCVCARARAHARVLFYKRQVPLNFNVSFLKKKFRSSARSKKILLQLNILVNAKMSQHQNVVNSEDLKLARERNSKKPKVTHMFFFPLRWTHWVLPTVHLRRSVMLCNISN